MSRKTNHRSFTESFNHVDPYVMTLDIDEPFDHTDPPAMNLSVDEPFDA